MKTKVEKEMEKMSKTEEAGKIEGRKKRQGGKEGEVERFQRKT